MHHASFSSADFLASYSEEPLPFCVGCHAPRAASLGIGEGGKRGIDCETCHPGAEAHERVAARSALAARESAPREPRACAECHELTSEGSGTFLQSTATEHAASPARDVPCASCHMRRTAAGTRDHAFAVSRDPVFLGAALATSAPIRSADAVRFTLAARGVGHKMPTGDIFRELVVHAWIEDERGRIVADREDALHRDWDAHRRAFRESSVPDPLADTRLDAKGAPFVLALPATATGPLVLRVTVHYRRGFEARGGVLSTFATLLVLDETRPLPPPTALVSPNAASTVQSGGL